MSSQDDKEVRLLWYLPADADKGRDAGARAPNPPGISIEVQLTDPPADGAPSWVEVGFEVVDMVAYGELSAVYPKRLRSLCMAGADLPRHSTIADIGEIDGDEGGCVERWSVRVGSIPTLSSQKIERSRLSEDEGEEEREQDEEAWVMASGIGVDWPSKRRRTGMKRSAREGTWWGTEEALSSLNPHTMASMYLKA